MSFNLTQDEREILISLTNYPHFYPAEQDNSLNYLASLQLAAKHPSGWTKGAKHQEAINWLKTLQPPRVRTCRNCGG